MLLALSMLGNAAGSASEGPTASSAGGACCSAGPAPNKSTGGVRACSSCRCCKAARLCSSGISPALSSKIAYFMLRAKLRMNCDISLCCTRALRCAFSTALSASSGVNWRCGSRPASASSPIWKSAGWKGIHAGAALSGSWPALSAVAKTIGINRQSHMDDRSLDMVRGGTPCFITLPCQEKCRLARQQPSVADLFPLEPE
mmetsp:Transcript_60666/g.112540  ORF Transcript_60666/g.112540 Transcript_60666/m.112540 type:complete len:201 (-) Transcript_60666:8-610(-)